MPPAVQCALIALSSSASIFRVCEWANVEDGRERYKFWAAVLAVGGIIFAAFRALDQVSGGGR